MSLHVSLATSMADGFAASCKARLDTVCLTPLGKGKVCGHMLRQHFGSGSCIAGTRSGESSVCGCPKFTGPDHG